MRKSLLLKLRFHPSPLWVIFEVSFLRNLAAAMLTSILALYFRQFVDSNAAVGCIFLVGYVSAFISNIYASHIVEHLQKRKTLLLAFIIFTVIFAGFAVAQHSTIVLLLFAVYQFTLALFVLDIGLYIKHYSNLRVLAENTGKLGSFSNIGWMIGPLLGSLIAATFGFEAVFLLSASVALIALLVFFFVRLEKDSVHFHHTHSFFGNAKRFFKDSNLRKTYINNAGLGFIFSIWDFLPLMMLGIGATIPIIGMTKTLMGVTQTIFEYPIGMLADKGTGERKIFVVGYVLAAIFTIMLGFVYDLHYFITFFFIAATGTSFLEMTRDSYFFRQMKESDIELLSVYRTSDTLPYLVGQGLAILTLSFLPLRMWFIIGGAIGLLFAVNAYFLKDLKDGTPKSTS